MPQPLSDVVGLLYRAPANGMRQVFALSRRQAERLPRLQSIAIVSITSPERPMASLEGFSHVLRLSFADVDFLNPALSQRAKSRIPDSFRADQARDIHAFIRGLPDNVASVVVHCEGGFSRSCAIALAIHRLYGYETSVQYLSQANSSIVQTMLANSSVP
ncbi:hypothetical protein [Cupriavidus sp. CP313]